MLRRFAGAARQAIWLDARFEAVKGSCAGAAERGWPEYYLASAALGQADAMRLAGPRRNPCILLYRDAVRLLLHAHSDVERAEPSAPSIDPDGSLARLLNESSDATLARLATAEARQASLDLRRAAISLSKPFERRATALRRIWLARAARVTALLTLLLGCTFFLLQRSNLARGKPVTLSHADAGFPGPAHLVDGDTHNIAFHDSGSAPHWATLDLETERLVSKVVVHNRADCCAERAVPLRIEIGDGEHFAQVALRETVFNTWRASFPGTRGRYVRLTSTNPAPFHLTEVEVY